jgi:hypothetical protein
MHFPEHSYEFIACSWNKDAVLIFKAYFSNGLGILRPTVGVHQAKTFTWSPLTGTTHLAIVVWHSSVNRLRVPTREEV